VDPESSDSTNMKVFKRPRPQSAREPVIITRRHAELAPGRATACGDGIFQWKTQPTHPVTTPQGHATGRRTDAPALHRTPMRDAHAATTREGSRSARTAPGRARSFTHPTPVKLPARHHAARERATRPRNGGPRRPRAHADKLLIHFNHQPRNHPEGANPREQRVSNSHPARYLAPGVVSRHQSQPFSQSYRSKLPTSLNYILPVNQRLLTLET